MELKLSSGEYAIPRSEYHNRRVRLYELINNELLYDSFTSSGTAEDYLTAVGEYGMVNRRTDQIGKPTVYELIERSVYGVTVLVSVTDIIRDVAIQVSELLCLPDMTAEVDELLSEIYMSTSSLAPGGTIGGNDGET